MVHLVRLLMLAVLLGVAGCDSKPTGQKVTSDDVRRDATRALDTTVEYSQQTKEEAQKNLDARLKDLDAKIAELREKGHDLKDQAKVDWDQRMVTLEAKREVARAKAAEIRDSSAEAWKDVQRGAQAAWDELDKAFHEASREF